MPKKRTPPSPEKVAAVIAGLEIMGCFPSFMRELQPLMENKKALSLYATSIAQFVSIEPEHHEVLDDTVIPLEWLLAEIVSTCQYFPKPIEMRRMYEQFFSPTDGVDSSELTNALEGE